MDFSTADYLPVATAFLRNNEDKIEYLYINLAYKKLFHLEDRAMMDDRDCFDKEVNDTLKTAIKLNKDKITKTLASKNILQAKLQYFKDFIVCCFDISPIQHKQFEVQNAAIGEELSEKSDKPYKLEFDDTNKATLCHPNGNRIPVSVGKVISANSSGDPLNCLLIKDLTEIEKRDKEIEHLKHFDGLTGLYNRTYFYEKLALIDNKKSLPVSIIIGDINGLKLTNDVFGKERGDQIIITVANIFSIVCRENDILARFGGDTFIIALPNTTMEQTKKIVMKITDLCNVETNGSTKLSVSIGYSCKLDSSQMFENVINNAEDFMCRNKMVEIQSYRSSFIAALKNTLYEKSYETEKHALRITDLCKKVGREMKLSQSEMNDLALFSMLHDIGKIGIDDSILSKAGPLTDKEWIEMKKHSSIGYSIARSSPELENIAYYILCHHERYDGKGYPNSLKNDDIPLLSRILSVVDSYDAMVNDRCYRKALSFEKAISEIKKNSGTQFDPKAVESFLKVVTKN